MLRAARENWTSARFNLIWRRMLTVVPVIFGVTLLTFLIMDRLPGNTARQMLGLNATQEQVAALEKQLDLDHPVWERYGEWLLGVATGDLGKSLASGQLVSTLLLERFPVTLELIGCTFVLCLALAVPCALLAAYRPGGWFDRISMFLSMAGLSVSSYVLALVLVLIFAVNLRWFPSLGFARPSAGIFRNLHTLTLPVIAIALPLACFYMQFLRGDLVEQLQGKDYIVTAVAKGIGPWRVVTQHALRNSLFGLLTLVGLNFGALLGGTVLVEQIFSIPGIGQLLLQAINTRDAAIVQAIVLFLALATLLANLTVDLLYLVLDPRIRDRQGDSIQ